MNETQVKRSAWPIAAATVVLLIMLAGTVWSFHHPYPVHWDESIYINEIQLDTQRLQHGMLLKLVGRLFMKAWGRPPAYRFIALPVLGLFGFHIMTARFISIACFGLSSLFVYLATRRIVGPAPSALAALIFCLSPIVVSASLWFSTEGPLYLATSAMFYYLFKMWAEEPEQSHSWVGLGLAIGLGLLSKASFLAVALPVMAFWFVAGLRRLSGVGNLVSEGKAGLLALVVAMPWWLLNIKLVISGAEQARGFVANSLGPASIATFGRWLNTVCQSLLGHGLSILISLVLITWIYKVFAKRDAAFDPLERAALWACACAGVPIVLLQLTGTNHLLRHISPAVIPLAVVVAVLVGKMGWDQSRWFTVLSGMLFSLQLLMIVFPVLFPNKQPLGSGFVNASLPWRIMARSDSWNWKPVFDISHDCGVDSPVIALLGMKPTFNPPQIQGPWAAAALSSSTTFPYPEVHLLWRYEEGPLDWQKVMGDAEQSDIVLTAPHLVGKAMDEENFDNQHNAEFAERLSRDGLFRTPISLEMGQLEPVEIQVFVKKYLSCHLPQQAAAQP